MEGLYTVPDGLSPTAAVFAAVPRGTNAGRLVTLDRPPIFHKWVVDHAEPRIAESSQEVGVTAQLDAELAIRPVTHWLNDNEREAIYGFSQRERQPTLQVRCQSDRGRSEPLRAVPYS